MASRHEGGRARSSPSPLQRLTLRLIDTYQLINDRFYERRAAAAAAAAISRPPSPRTALASAQPIDDDNFDLIIRRGEVLQSRYVVQERIGKGSFGQVIRCYDERNGEHVAVKIIKSRRAYTLQAQTELAILTRLRKADQDGRHHIVRFLNDFSHKGHQCFVFEELSHNLFDLLKQSHFKGVSLQLLKQFAKQILETLTFLGAPDISVIHCDLKPENVLLVSAESSQVRVIDFGSACFCSQRTYSYVQSRFYRSPEVILGLPYNTAIDMWSLGCILVEMLTGDPLFSGNSSHDQLCKIVEMLGPVPTNVLRCADMNVLHHYFDAPPPPPPGQPWQCALRPTSGSCSGAAAAAAAAAASAAVACDAMSTTPSSMTDPNTTTITAMTTTGKAAPIEAATEGAVVGMIEKTTTLSGTTGSGSSPQVPQAPHLPPCPDRSLKGVVLRKCGRHKSNSWSFSMAGAGEPTSNAKWTREALRFVDLVEQMLVMDPDQRIRPAVALQHPFLDGNAPPAPPNAASP